MGKATSGPEQGPTAMDKMLDLIGEIYEASFNPGNWNAAITRLCEYMQARSGALFIEDHGAGTRGMIGAHGLSGAVRLSYRLGMGKHDQTFKLQRAQPLGEARQLVESRLIRREHPLYYSLILRPHDIGHIAVMNIYNDDEWHVGLGLHRSFKADAFSADELRDLNRLYPHLSRALRIHKEFHRLRHRQQSIDAALSRVLMGLIILGPDGTALYSNPVADSLLKRHPGLVLNGGRPQAHFAHENRRLQAMLDDLALADPADIDRHDLALGLHHPERDQPLNVVLATLNAPYGEHADMARGNVALYLCDPASRFHFSLDTLHALYDLTPAEARVAMALTNGQTPKQIAESQGVVVDTVRSQLKSLYVKMGVNKQQDVIRVLLSGAVTRPARTVID